MRAYDYVPTREMIADALGLRSETTDSTSALMIFAAGALFGTALALLFAPRPGDELRADIRKRVSNLQRRAASEAKEALGQA